MQIIHTSVRQNRTPQLDVFSTLEAFLGPKAPQIIYQSFKLASRRQQSGFWLRKVFTVPALGMGFSNEGFELASRG
jgi:hypothetical protein